MSKLSELKVYHRGIASGMKVNDKVFLIYTASHTSKTVSLLGEAFYQGQETPTKCPLPPLGGTEFEQPEEWETYDTIYKERFPNCKEIIRPSHGKFVTADGTVVWTTECYYSLESHFNEFMDNNPDFSIDNVDLDSYLERMRNPGGGESYDSEDGV